MNSEPSVPLSTLAKKLAYCEGIEFQLILRKLASPAYINEQLLKSELPLVSTKIQKLLKSGKSYDVWKGCHASVILCSYNPLALCVYGGQILEVIYSRLEQKKEYHATSCESFPEKLVFKSLTSALSVLIRLMRGKPTLSRESLVPKLKAIIPCLIDLTPLEPELCLPILKGLLFKNSTTFRPFVNKYRQVLWRLITDDYENLDNQIRSLVCDNYAYLHLIKLQGQNSMDEHQSHHKTSHDETWRIGILSVLSQFKPVLKLCNEVLDLDCDRDLTDLINKLECDNLNPTSHGFLPGLKIDLNEPITLWQIPLRLNQLIDILIAFLSLPTPYAVRIPIGFCISVFESLLGITRNFLPLRREIRHDGELVSVVCDVLPQIQFSGVRLLHALIRNFGKCCLSMLPSILGSLEFFIPLEPKSRNIDMRTCKLMRNEFLFYFQVLNLIFAHMGYQLQELDFFEKLVEVALALSDDQNLISCLTDDIPVKNQSSKAGRKQKKDGTIGALSDIYTHPSEFTLTTSLVWHEQINLFLCGLINNLKLPSNQQIKIIRYGVQGSLSWKKKMGRIPQCFVELLRTLVVYPGKERVSILPIAASLLKGSSDEVFDLLCHPRLPMNMILNAGGKNDSLDIDSLDREQYPENAEEEPGDEQAPKEEQEEQEKTVTETSGTKRQAPETRLSDEPEKKQKLGTNIPLFRAQNHGASKTEGMKPNVSIEKQTPASTGKSSEPPDVSTEKQTPASSREASDISNGKLRPSPVEEQSESESELVIPQIHLSDDEDDDNEQ